jgi:hypothetical protein
MRTCEKCCGAKRERSDEFGLTHAVRYYSVRGFALPFLAGREAVYLKLLSRPRFLLADAPGRSGWLSPFEAACVATLLRWLGASASGLSNS